MKKAIGITIIVAVILLAAYHLFIFYDNNFPNGRMWETPAVRPHENPLLIMETGIVPFHGGEENYKTTPVEALTSPLGKGNPEHVAKGKKGYFNYCAQCHGKYHDGKGTVGQSFFPLPTDLRSRKVQETPDGKMFKEISFGTPNGRQPALATTISVQKRWQIIAYIKSLGIRYR
jgi:cytochrome c1